MKIIGYSLRPNPPKTSPFLDEVVALYQYSDLGGDYAIDITLGELTQDPRKWLDGGVAYYGDYYDQNGMYCLHSLFPYRKKSIRTIYPGIIYKTSVLAECKTKNPLEEICANNIIHYVPSPFFRIKA